MDARTAAAQPQGTVVKRKVAVIPVEVKAIQEVEIWADSILLGLSKTAPFGLVVASPEGSGMVKRKLWIAGVGGEFPVEAQNGDYLGDAYLPSAEDANKLVLLVAFVETQKQAIDRARHYGSRAVAP